MKWQFELEIMMRKQKKMNTMLKTRHFSFLKANTTEEQALTNYMITNNSEKRTEKS